MVWRNADGSWIEQYYRMGKLHREDGPAIIWRKPDGSMSHAYYRDDERYQRLLGWAGDGLGVSSDGARTEYCDGDKQRSCRGREIAQT
jgi:hypothetical protein